jgi:hypothetical protein
LGDLYHDRRVGFENGDCPVASTLAAANPHVGDFLMFRAFKINSLFNGGDIAWT